MTCSAPLPSASRSHVFLGAPKRYHVRPARPDDRESLRRMLEQESPEGMRRRFFRAVNVVSDTLLDPLLRDDGARHVALVTTTDNPRDIVASAMLVAMPGTDTAEFGILVARAHSGQRLGSHLMECLAREGRARGLGSIYGVILSENAEMVDLARRHGFRIEPSDEPGCVRAVLRL